MSEKKPNGRPRKRPENQRTQVMHLRMTEDEMAQLAGDAAAMNLTKADFIRHRVLGKTTGSRKANPERAAVIRTIANIGHLCEALRKKTDKNLNKELYRLNEAIKIKLARFPRKDDPRLYDELGFLSMELIKQLQKTDGPDHALELQILETLSNNLMSFLNGH